MNNLNLELKLKFIWILELYGVSMKTCNNAVAVQNNMRLRSTQNFIPQKRPVTE